MGKVDSVVRHKRPYTPFVLSLSKHEQKSLKP